MKLSANLCSHCKKRYLSLVEDAMGMIRCAECQYFYIRGIYSVEDYNNWLKQNG